MVAHNDCPNPDFSELVKTFSDEMILEHLSLIADATGELSSQMAEKVIEHSEDLTRLVECPETTISLLEDTMKLMQDAALCFTKNSLCVRELVRRCGLDKPGGDFPPGDYRLN